MFTQGAPNKSQGDGGKVWRGGCNRERSSSKTFSKTMGRVCAPTDNFQPQSFQTMPFSLLLLLLEERESQISMVRHL